MAPLQKVQSQTRKHRTGKALVQRQHRMSSIQYNIYDTITDYSSPLCYGCYLYVKAERVQKRLWILHILGNVSCYTMGFAVWRWRSCRKVGTKMLLAWYYCYIINWKPAVDVCMFSFSRCTSWEGGDVGFASRGRYNPLCSTPGDVVIHLSSFIRQTKLVKARWIVYLGQSWQSFLVYIY